MKIMLPWLILSFCICLPFTLARTNINSIQCFDNERDALLQFKDGMISDVCGLLTSWESDVDCCQWHGVHCSSRTGYVIALDVSREGLNDGEVCGLEGKVSPSLGELKHLKVLNLSNTFFDGEIPQQLGNLSKLTTLDLSHSHDDYDGSIKSLQWISRLRLLRYLDLSNLNLSKFANWVTIVNGLHFLNVLRMANCDLPTRIPSSLTYNNSSTTLHYIDLSNNFFQDNSIFCWLFNLSETTTQLVHLDLSQNSFKGPVPSEFGNYHSLSYLNLFGNSFQGLVPNEFGEMRSLSYLDLSFNSFQGLVPNEFGKMHSLSYLDLSQNSFQGSVLKPITTLCNLQNLRLSGNNFTDELTNVIQSIVSCENKALITLDLSWNRFWGPIPNTISSFSLLWELDLSNNQLNGEVSTGLGQLSMLESLDISSNKLEGTITHTHFLNLSKLFTLYLSDNPKLLINIDMNWIPPFQLDSIGLSSCELGSRFPKWLETQTNFLYFDISNSNISGNFPMFVLESSNLNYLNISNNMLYGKLPNLPKKLKVISSVDLSSNLFEGVIPSGFAKVKSLYLNDNKFSDFSNILCPQNPSALFVLDLSNNLFTGQLPDCWMNLNQLSSLHLENNRFSGGLPKSIGTLTLLANLNLYNNSFSGPILALENCTSLTVLNLGYNSFSGDIPPWIGNAFQRVALLILRKNHFIGAIPQSVCQLAKLQILDMASNSISGVIPNCISNFTAMKNNTIGIDFEIAGPYRSIYGVVSGSAKETAIMSWKRMQQMFKGPSMELLKFIDLSRNKLNGKIPDEITSLVDLVSLDLSGNNLSGSIPSEIGNLTNLELLDFSNNHLTGAIPTSLAKVTTLGILDVSNNNLSGEIPVSTQLQSFSPSSYLGNPGLCGSPLPKCLKDQAPSNDDGDVEDEHDFDFYLGLYISVVLGFIVGFWGVCGTLVIKRSWRYAYFRLLQDIKDTVLG